jgi:hypothetical protein
VTSPTRLPFLHPTGVARDLAFFVRIGQPAYVIASDTLCRGLLLLQGAIPHTERPPAPPAGSSRGGTAPPSPAGSIASSATATLEEVSERPAYGPKNAEMSAPAAALEPGPATLPAAPRAMHAAAAGALSASVTQRFKAAAAALAREAAACNLLIMPGVDRARLEVVVIDSAEAAAAAAGMRAHLAAAPFFGLDSEGTYDKAMARDRMCLIALMAPACRGHPKGAQVRVHAARGPGPQPRWFILGRGGAAAAAWGCPAGPSSFILTPSRHLLKQPSTSCPPCPRPQTRCT